ncbi:helix-turn-helix domain-containing protein [Anaerococcus vaginalis]|uniref:helix-turn-helix domain-containing protein n=1 Tax=Anaerococcus vaginalis TaxID=33037 RepID=UPI00290D350E|nr:helix-turn-helix domain-containing protein [Anaerococcus vaginalis]MDU5461626.1 helix-turn-helix domain-containing protein [Anaerococcus vaginalis]
MNLKDYLGETNLYDKKEKLERNKPKSWLKSVSAFANGRGGKLIFGVKEDNTILGLSNYQEDSENISEIIKIKMDPNPEFDMEIKEIDGTVILILSIFAGKNTPYFVVDGGTRTAYKRIGNQSVPASRIDLFNLSLKGEHISYDSLESKKRLKDVRFKELSIEYKNRTEKNFEEKDLKSFGLVNDEGNLTIAGALFADDYQVYQSRVFCTRWNGLTKANGRMDALDDIEFEGNIIYLLKASLDFVKRNSKKMWKKGPVFRIEYPEYPERAVQEALVNALIHRDYSVIGSEVHVDIYDDRLEIYSPGGMYDGTFIQDINPLNVSSIRRNPIIADVFARMDLMERRGSGLRKIIEAYEAEKNYKEELKPEFKSTESSFTTILKNLNYDTQNVTQNDGQSEGQNEGENEGQNDGKKLKPKGRRNKIVKLMKENSNITTIELSHILLVSVSTIERDLKILTDEKTIEYIGSAKDGYWKVNK